MVPGKDEPVLFSFFSDVVLHPERDRQSSEGESDGGDQRHHGLHKPMEEVPTAMETAESE